MILVSVLGLKSMFKLENKPTVSAKVLAIVLFALASATVAVIGLQGFDIFPVNAAGTIAPAERVVHVQIGNASEVSSDVRTTDVDMMPSTPTGNAVTTAVESSVDDALNNAMSNNTNDVDCATYGACGP